MGKAKTGKMTADKSATHKPARSIGVAAREMNKWTFFTNHAHVLILLHADPDAILREIATQVGITERAVQRIVQDLEEGGFIERERIGRRNRYRILRDRYLRHPIESHCKIDDLIGFIVSSSKKRGDKKSPD